MYRLQEIIRSFLKQPVIISH